MPNLPLPDEDYLGSPDRTTGEFQAQINDLQNWVLALQAELSALSTTTLGEAAVRGVGSSTGQVPDKAVLDTRLGTTGNLGGMALEATDEYLSNSARLVWSGSDSTPNMSELTEGGPGLYIVKDSGGAAHSVYVRSTTEKAAGSASIEAVGTNSFTIYALEYTSTGDFRVEELDYSSGSTFVVLNLIEAIYKV